MDVYLTKLVIEGSKVIIPVLYLFEVIPSTSAVDAKDDSDLQSSFLSTFMATQLFNSAILSQIHYAESFQAIPDSPSVRSTAHLLKNGLVSLSMEIDSAVVCTGTCISKSSRYFAGVVSDSHSLIPTFLSGSYPRDHFPTNETDSSNVTLSENLTDALNLNSALQYSNQSFKGQNIVCAFRGDFLLKSSYPVNKANSHQAVQMNSLSNCKALSQNPNPTEERSISNTTNVFGANLLFGDSVLGSTDSLLITTEKEANNSSTSTAECAPWKPKCDSSSSVQDRDKIKYITIANVSGPVCLSADCLDVARLCMCDQECLIYKDCCSSYIFSMVATVSDHDLAIVDITHGLEVIQNRLIESYPKTVYRKHTFISSHSRCIRSTEKRVLMIGLCPALFSNEEDKLKCEMAENKVSITNIPVVQKDDLYGIHVHFKNVYCALCHNVSALEVTFWDVTASCQEGLPDNFTYLDMLKKCKFLIKPPEGSDSDIRTCIPNDFPLRECEQERTQISNVRDQNFVSLCQFYISPITHESVIYRNMHCAACSTEEREFLSKSICLLGLPDISDLGIISEDLKVLFDFSPKEGLSVIVPCSPKKKIQCKEKQMYDCISRTCRTIYCQNQQTVMDDCVPRLFVTVPIALPDAELFLTNPDVFILVFEMIENFRDITNVDIEYYTSEIEKNRHRLEFAKSLNITASEFVFQSNTLNISLKITAFMSSLVNLPQLLSMMDTVSSREEVFFKTAFKSILLQNYVHESRLHCSVGYLMTTSAFILNHEKNTTTVYLYDLKSYADISQVRFKLSLFPTDTKTESISYCEINQTSILNCQIVLLDKNEYRLENGLLYLINTTKVYRNGTFILEDRGAFICVDTLVGFEKIFKMFDYSPYQYILSVVTKAISMVALLAIIVFHIMFPNLRNLHGLNLTALSATLFLAHGLLFVYHIPTGSACQVTGVILHFLWLSVFAWMNIIGFDVTRTFYSGRISVLIFVTRRFRRYLVVAFGIPLMLVTISVLFHILHGPIDIDYGKNDQCWLGNQEAVTVFFLAPIIVSVSINIILLGITIVAIERAKKTTELVRSRKDRAYCLVYFKLTVILGLSWFAGITAVFVDIPELWYIHIVFNGLQGLSILICFALNARFLKAMRERPSHTKSITRNSERRRY